jgi:hypothetical protein
VTTAEPHPLYAAIDAAISEHGWPEEAYGIHLNKYGRCGVNALGAGLPDGWGDTCVDAYSMAMEAKRRLEQGRADAAARRELLAFCADNNISPTLIRA